MPVSVFQVLCTIQCYIGSALGIRTIQYWYCLLKLQVIHMKSHFITVNFLTQSPARAMSDVKLKLCTKY